MDDRPATRILLSPQGVRLDQACVESLASHPRLLLVAGEALISKRWGGGLREIFTDADTFMVDFGNGIWTEEQRQVIFAAAMSIDFDFFENNQGSRGVLN